jgi:hypothetical protein
MAATRIDCDIHPAVGGTRTTLLPYLDDHWKEQVVSRKIFNGNARALQALSHNDNMARHTIAIAAGDGPSCGLIAPEF